MSKDLKRRTFIRMAALTSAGIALASKGTSAPYNNVASGKRVGIIGLDTSHASAFTKALNDVNAGAEYKGYKIVAAYPHGTKDIKSALDRAPGFLADVKALGVEIVDSIEALLKKVDVVLLESNDGRVHLQQALPVLKAKKKMFIDKPIAASYADAKAIFAAAEKYNTPIFSSSSLRYIDGMADAIAGKNGKIIGAQTYSPCTLEKTHPDFYWYGIHGVEMLFTLMGPDCKSVTRVHTDETDLAIGTWDNGRIGAFRGTRSGKKDYGATVFAEKATSALGEFKGYNPLLLKIIDFFETGTPPVSKQETLAICAFIEAADLSKTRGGTPVSIDEIIK
jgi:predicted dehydrogenase